MQEVKIGIVIVGHGSRLQESVGIYEEIAKRAGKKSGLDVKVGYMKFKKPSIIETINAFIEKGTKKLIIVPLFLLPGMHVKNDIPILLGLRKGKVPEFGYEKINLPDGVEILYARHIGADERLADVVLDRVKEVLG